MRKWLVWILLGAIIVAGVLLPRWRPQGDSFGRLTSLGVGYYEKGEATNAIAAFSKAVELTPQSIDAQLNLANAYLLAGNLQKVVEQSQQALKLDQNSAAAYYLLGCAYLRSNQAEAAVQAFQQSQKIDPAVNALNFQLGLAQERAGHIEDAIQQFETVTQFEPEHPSGHYQLSRLYQRAGRANEAAQELSRHEEIRAKNPAPSNDPTTFERCKYTQPKLAVAPEEPQQRGIAVRFVDASSNAFSGDLARYRGPVGVLDYNHDGRNSLFVMESNGFRLLNNSNGQFKPLGELLSASSSNTYTRCLVGDLNNDRFEDVVMLGTQSSHLFRFATNGQVREVTQAAGLKELKGRDGLLADLDFTGKLDLLVIDEAREGLRVWSNLGNAYFRENTTNSGLPLKLPGIAQVAIEDLNNEDVPGVLVSVKNRAPLFFSKKRAGSFVETNLTANWPVGTILTVGDLNNDLLLDFVLADDHLLHIGLAGAKKEISLSLNGFVPTGLLLVDYDNDGWLDILAYGNGIRLWRNAGKTGFQDVTVAAGLNNIGPVDSAHAADFDGDGDTDLLLVSSKGLQLWRNDGGNVNKQLKLHLMGNRSNASALGARVEITAGNWRAIRTLHQLPLEVGIGNHTKIDVLKVRWFDLATTLVDLPTQPQPLTVAELTFPGGSCPYLYTWNGDQFRFVTDILGSAPMGLPISHTRFVDADPEEFLALGSDEQFPARNGAYELRITEELREVLYLDEARLVVVDHPTGTLVHATSKMLPGPPFPAHQLWNLRPLASLKKAIRSDDLDVTEALTRNDGVMASPVRLREPQLRGLAEPFSITFDFGLLPVDRPLVLVMNGWLRFGGGMANIAASLDPSLPFPFPTLEAELADGSWKPVDIQVGVPAGKTKTILIDLENKLPRGSRRLRWSSSFEIHWDSLMLSEKLGAVFPEQNPRSLACIVHSLTPTSTDLRWHGFSQFAPLPDSLPLTPQYEKVLSTPRWRRTPSGWCTHYGSVNELVAQTDNALVILNGGDELALTFKTELPAKPVGYSRAFFLHVVGWDKDADFHVAAGSQVEPLPFIGMNSQTYGSQPSQPAGSDSWTRKFNTRWVGPLVLERLPR